MKININTNERYTETEVTINCLRMSDDIEKLLAALRMLDMKLTGRKDGQQHILEASDIIYIESTDKRTFLYTSAGVFESAFKLYELEAKLANGDFLRASKNCLFNINHIQSIKPDLDRRLILTFEKDIKLIVSRQYSAAVKQRLEAYNG
ncbi:MAG: LytTR family transcriptional regulator DNA-binding domain-containing protein [Treponema sp.]|jgi:DNA-binding LytR/AlgR family response regulator|nr:LytTR family transcriptional regulator DNA-binding domain-containing protein [Treponema sp.]